MQKKRFYYKAREGLDGAVLFSEASKCFTWELGSFKPLKKSIKAYGAIHKFSKLFEKSRLKHFLIEIIIFPQI